MIDADLQDPPELIPELVQQWQAGYDVVYATRSARAGESGFKRFTAAAFYRTMEMLSDVPVPRDTGDFRLLSRRALKALAQLRERQRFMKGLFAWIGYRQTSIQYLRDPRKAGKTKWNYWRLAQFAIEGITSFSSAPLRLATWTGLAASLVAFLMGLKVLIKALLHSDPVPGYPSLMVVVLFLGGIQLLALGVIANTWAATTLKASSGRSISLRKSTSQGSAWAHRTRFTPMPRGSAKLSGTRPCCGRRGGWACVRSSTCWKPRATTSSRLHPKRLY